MAIQTPELSAMAVANAFVTRYYAILHHCPENVHKFYQEESVLGWPGPDDAISLTTTLQVSDLEERYRVKNIISYLF